MAAAECVILNPDLFRYIQSFILGKKLKWIKHADKYLLMANPQRFIPILRAEHIKFNSYAGRNACRTGNLEIVKIVFANIKLEIAKLGPCPGHCYTPQYNYNSCHKNCRHLTCKSRERTYFKLHLCPYAACQSGNIEIIKYLNENFCVYFNKNCYDVLSAINHDYLLILEYLRVKTKMVSHVYRRRDDDY